MSINPDKGKGVDPNERTPLLVSVSSSAHPVPNAPTSITTPYSSTSPARSEISEIEVSRGRGRRTGRLINILIVICSLLFGACLFLSLLLASYIPSPKELENLQDAVVFHGPTDVQILNITSSGLWLEVEGYMGVDVDQILGVDRVDVHEGQRGGGAWWWESVRKFSGRTVVHALGPIEVSSLRGLEVWSTDGTHRALLSATIPVVVPVPLTTRVNNMTYDKTLWSIPPWLTAVRVPVHVQPKISPKSMLALAKKALADGSINIELRVDSVDIKAVEDRGWRGYISRTERDIRVPVAIDVPEIPGIPSRDMDFSKLVKLESYSLNSSHLDDANEAPRLRITVIATAPNPTPHMAFDIPYRFGFGIYLQGDASTEKAQTSSRMTKMAEVSTAPIRLVEGQKRVVIRIEGLLLSTFGSTTGEPAPAADEDSALSNFLRRYIRGLDNPVVVKGLPYLPHIPPNPSRESPPPKWMLDMAQSLELNVTFPGPKPVPKLIRSVTIQDMRISESRGHMTASGIVLAEVELPDQMKHIDVDVKGVLPDVLVFDGYPEDQGDIDPDDLPYPARAFGRIRPEDYLPSETSRSNTQDGILLVRAPIHDVPVEVLQGRDKIMSDFVSKIIFRGGARAGIKGLAGVNVAVSGLESSLRIGRVPVTGEFIVGKPRLSL